MKYIVILITALFLGTSIQATEKAPIMPRKANNGEYTRAESEAVATGDGQISIWWRTNLLMLVNRGLTASGTGIKVDESNIHWIFEHITYDFKDLGPYVNSRLSDGTPEWFTDKDGWSGNVAIFRYMTCTIILYKTQCLNLLDIPVKVTTPPTAPYVPPATPPSKVDTVRVGNVTVVNHIYNTNTNTNTNTVSTPASEARYVIGEEEQQCVQPISRPVYYNQPPVMMRRPQVRLNFTVRGGRQQQFYQPVQQERGYMGGGRQGVGGGGQGYMGGGGNNNNGNQGGGRPY